MIVNIKDSKEKKITARNILDIYNIQKISIPQSVWEEKDEILKNIAESIAESVCSLKFDIKVNINCDPECVETDYNGR